MEGHVVVIGLKSKLVFCVAQSGQLTAKCAPSFREQLLPSVQVEAEISIARRHTFSTGNSTGSILSLAKNGVCIGVVDVAVRSGGVNTLCRRSFRNCYRLLSGLGVQIKINYCIIYPSFVVLLLLGPAEGSADILAPQLNAQGPL